MPPQQSHGLLDVFDKGFGFGAHWGSKIGNEESVGPHIGIGRPVRYALLAPRSRPHAARDILSLRGCRRLRVVASYFRADAVQGAVALGAQLPPIVGLRLHRRRKKSGSDRRKGGKSNESSHRDFPPERRRPRDEDAARPTVLAPA
jgi:hypothetical protein